MADVVKPAFIAYFRNRHLGVDQLSRSGTQPEIHNKVRNRGSGAQLEESGKRGIGHAYKRAQIVKANSF